MPGVFGQAVEVAKRIRRLRDRWTDEQASKRTFPCRPGCSSCCHQPVGTLIVEGVLIAFRLGVDPLPAGGRKRGEPCPFLLVGRCSIYRDRPMSCSTLFPASETCTEMTKNVDNRAPVHAARELDLAFCRKIGFPWPGPLYLDAAVRVGRLLLAGERPHVEPEDCTMAEADVARLRGVV